MQHPFLTALFLTSTLLFTQAEEGPSLAEDPSTINQHQSRPTAEKPWANKAPVELRQWAKDNLHFKLIGKRLISEDENPEWAWFRKSGLGIFLHWGLASVPPADGDAWAMVWNEHRAKNNLLRKAEDMFAVADTWNPKNYNPEQWMAAASKAGFGYAVLTTRHHDGYCLWPTQHGTWDTGEKMNGRDLVKGYVDACRKNDIKIGFYYSGPNWHSYYKLKDFSHPPVGYNYKLEKVGKEAGLVPLMGGGQLPPELAKKELAQSHGQVTELLTNYGKIDMMWWDGNSIMQEKEVHSLQPNTFVARGNIATPEGLHQGASQNVKVTNECGWWWEMCVKAENKHSPNWHYNPRNEAPGNHWTTNTLLTELIRCRSLGGNLLVNITPRPDGSMMDWYYQTCQEMSAWMKHSREAIYDIQLTAPLPTLDKTQNFTTLAKDGTLYSLHDEEGKILINSIAKPESVTLLRTGEALPHSFENGTLSLAVPKEKQTKLPDLVKIILKK
jgi:alpha-L-fucosidase